MAVGGYTYLELMPYCRSCHQQISKFDTDICPYCGEKNPISSGYKTLDVTRTFGTIEGREMPKTKSQRTFAILAMTLGYFGVHNFYIYRPKRGLIDILITLVLVLGVGFGLFFGGVMQNAMAFLIPFFVVWAAHIALGVYYLKIESPKDGKGDFLR